MNVSEFVSMPVRRRAYSCLFSVANMRVHISYAAIESIYYYYNQTVLCVVLCFHSFTPFQSHSSAGSLLQSLRRAFSGTRAERWI